MKISIHALLAESDKGYRPARTNKEHFYPRSPCGERPLLRFRFFGFVISIHALLAESDSGTSKNLICTLYFYPRSPCGERPANALPITSPTTFLSTLSLRRATIGTATALNTSLDFYPRSPCGERLCKGGVCAMIYNFYPRSPCGERPGNAHGIFIFGQFLSTLSLRRATLLIQPIAMLLYYFYPRSPCGERQVPSASGRIPTQIFLSTLSLRRATLCCRSEVLNNSLFLSTLSLRRATAKVHKTVGHFCAYETNFMEIASSC